MNPIEKFNWSLKILRISFDILQQNIFVANYRYNKGYFAVVLFFAFFITNYIYTFAFRELDSSILMVAIAECACAIQAAFKYALLRRSRPMLDILICLKPIYEHNSQPYQKHYALCLKFARIMELLSMIIFLSYFPLSFLNVLPTLVGYFSTGKITPCLNAYIVGITEDTHDILVFTNFLNFVMLIVLMFVIATVDILTYLVFLNIVFVSLIIEQNVREFEGELMLRKSYSTNRIINRDCATLF